MRATFLYAIGTALLLAACARSLHQSSIALPEPPPGPQPIPKKSSERKKQVYMLRADCVWQLDLPNGDRFDASGLLLSQGQLLTVNDRGSELFRIELGEGASAKLVPTGMFSHARVSKAANSPKQRYDTEGIARDEAGNFYICEEEDRAVYKLDPKGKGITQLRIDWSPVARFFSADANASFEGIAAGGGRLYLANERSQPGIVVVDSVTLAVVDSFAVDASNFAFGGAHYADLSWFDGHLYVLDRNHRVVLQVDAAEKRVLAEFAFGEMELEPEVAYQTDYPTGTMEGLAVDANYFWLVTDNNGQGRYKYPHDTRPALFRCKRPDVE